MTARRLLAALLAASALATPALAQDDRRLSDLQRQVKELRAIVFQGRDTGQPVEVKPVGPDPQVVALQAKVDELGETERRMTGQQEQLQHDLDEARRTAEQLRTEAGAYRQAADARIARLEAQLAPPPPPPAEAAPAALPPPPAATAPPLRPPVSRRGAELTARIQAGDTSRFGDAAPPAAAADAFADASQRLGTGDYAGAQAGFESYIARNPAGTRTPEARYQLGQSLYGRESYATAARAYAESLKGWPKTTWAPDATVRLAQSLAQINQTPSACAALAEFGRRYGAGASAAVKARAASTRARAQCAAG